jgi:hypothetical protein
MSDTQWQVKKHKNYMPIQEDCHYRLLFTFQNIEQSCICNINWHPVTINIVSFMFWQTTYYWQTTVYKLRQYNIWLCLFVCLLLFFHANFKTFWSSLSCVSTLLPLLGNLSLPIDSSEKWNNTYPTWISVERQMPISLNVSDWLSNRNFCLVTSMITKATLDYKSDALPI